MKNRKKVVRRSTIITLVKYPELYGTPIRTYARNGFPFSDHIVNISVSRKGEKVMNTISLVNPGALPSLKFGGKIVESLSICYGDERAAFTRPVPDSKTLTLDLFKANDPWVDYEFHAPIVGDFLLLDGVAHNLDPTLHISMSARFLTPEEDKIEKTLLPKVDISGLKIPRTIPLISKYTFNSKFKISE